tara:strand:- start:48 stop:296 length:249 start_codon:yes stop_codon:yes gene_type:complete
MDSIELFLDHWVLYRKKDPNIPTLNGRQAEFELALRELINEEKSKLLDSLRDKTKGESIDEYLGIKENTRELGMVSSIVTRE